MSSYIDNIMLIISIIFLIMAVAMLAALIYLIILGIRNPGPVYKDDDEEQAEYMRQYILKKEEKKRARAVSRELRRRRISEGYHEQGASAENPGARILPEEHPEGVLFSGEDKKGSEKTIS